MCRLRLITKSKDNQIVCDKEFSLEKVDIPTLDRPSYAIFYQEKKRIDFFYPNSSEYSLSKVSPDMDITFGYGGVSGRCSYVIINKFELFETDIFRFSEEIIEESQGNKRFADNIRSFLKLIQQLLNEIKK